ncbi:MAG TPA: allantoinase [Blastocatellia bacterium]|nr:allantoinase [Blastocatellia bacterium]
MRRAISFKRIGYYTKDMEKLILVYGMRLIAEERIEAIEHAQVTIEGGAKKQVTMHTIEGSREQIRRQLIESIDAFFELHS